MRHVRGEAGVVSPGAAAIGDDGCSAHAANSNRVHARTGRQSNVYCSRVRWFALCLFAACGDNLSLCEVHETDDTANDTAAEDAGLSLSHLHDVCGVVDPGHFANGVVDTDRYKLSLPADATVLVRITGDDALKVLDGFVVRFYDTTANPRLYAEVPFHGDHGAQLVDLPAGDYVMAVTASAGGNPSAAIAYRVELLLGPACAPATSTPYSEGTADNDAVSVSFANSPVVSGMSGTPEDTKLVATASSTLHIAGTSDGAAHTDSYDDRDSFVFRTDDTANELIVRLDWADQTADLDFYLFDSDLDIVAAGDLGAPGLQEIRAVPVEPNRSYLLWVGGFKGTHAPASYDATLCGTHFFH